MMDAMALAHRAAALIGGSPARADRLSGGDLATLVRIVLSDNRTIIAKQSGDTVAEAAMLRAIADTGTPTADVLAVDDGVLVLWELHSGGRLAGRAWDSLAAVLDKLHSATGERYVWPDDYAFGAVPIINRWHDAWPSFWAENRLLCHMPSLPVDLGRRMEALCARIGELLPAHPYPSLLHGDLWGGNILVSGEAVSGLIDPACYYGDREVDAAMLTLFDRPPATFFDRLELADGWRERQPIYRLGPLLVHLRLFGSVYVPVVKSALAEVGF